MFVAPLWLTTRKAEFDPVQTVMNNISAKLRLEEIQGSLR
jgi:hypothetical protein